MKEEKEKQEVASKLSTWCRHITDTPASEREFLENLHELDHKINFLNIQVKITKVVYIY